MKLASNAPRRPDGFDFATAFALVAGVLVAGYIAMGCSPAATAASSAYLAEQLACVDQAQTKDEATTCRNRVKARWATDGGAP
jgi:hypothetical protein